MVRNKEKYLKAREFRERGFTYSEIAKIVGLSTATLSGWFSKQPFSKRIRKDNEAKARRDNAKRILLINKARGAEREKRYREAIRTAETEFKHYRTIPLFIAGLMIYVGEGDNRHSRLIRIANSRMDVHRIFIRFAVEFLGIHHEDIRFWMLLYPDLSESSCKKTWSKTLKLPESQFYKSQVIQGKSLKRTLHNGVGNTIIGNAILKRKLMRWIELASKDLGK